MWNVFEQPWTMLAAAVVVFLVMQIVCMVISKKRRWLAIGRFALPTFIALLGLGLDYFVQTDLEQIKTLINTSVKAVENEDCSTIEAIIADNYRDSQHNTKKDLLAHCKTEFATNLIARAKKTACLVESSPPTANVALFVMITFDKNSRISQEYKSSIFVKAKLYLQKQPDKSWLINRIEVLEIDKQRVDWKDIR
jgi:Holliday junction resolvase-like predicted endonuclease